ncbi:tRNA:m(4)X modification enzyme TRM13 homolog isoform X2 [Sinocyclocheilus grahami]|uniref:tRNA:m(4)X modification enzyme TRM13 homolog isoform X2 n=1 Tax=Sinocyclocheilus grahami TaxID=75366 RepID=UPI0007AC78D8|nr:PREDICTED: tRNA:m(4)X modification enzyme TRM13 homolog isoform X2 [Sinocyclocheilus grahami]
MALINRYAFNNDASMQITIAERSKKELDELIVKLKTALKGLNTKLVENIISHSALHEPLSDPKNGDSAFKHLKQQASILGNMEVLELLSPNRCYIEFGAGKGKLSHWIHIALKAAENVHFLLVERSSTRFKVDGKHKNAGSTFDRLQVDIQHLDLRNVPLLREKGLPVIGVGKHLCGAATDLALRCLFEHSCFDEDDEPPTKRVKLHQNEGACDDIKPVPSTEGRETGEKLIVSGLAIALCCHHRCDWRHYVGKEFFRQRGLGPEEFAAFQRMSSWATCGMRKIGSKTTEKRSEHKTGEEEEHEMSEEALPDTLNSLMSVEDWEQIGRLCKQSVLPSAKRL